MEFFFLFFSFGTVFLTKKLNIKETAEKRNRGAKNKNWSEGIILRPANRI